MPQPVEVERIAAELARMFAVAQADIERQLATITEGRRAARLRELQRTVNTLLSRLDTQTRIWVQQQLPIIYELGGLDAAAIIGDAFVWTQPHAAALQVLATRSFDDLLSATRFVRRDVKDWIRNQARQQMTLSLLEGRTARQAGRALADAAGGDLNVFTVVYKNGSRHRLADYADSSIRAVSAETYNTGTIIQSRDAGVTAMECADGADCGLSSHDDGNKPNGRVFSIDVAAAYPLAHPRCRRSWLPRIDVRRRDIPTATSLRSEAQRADQAASELVTRQRARRQPRGQRAARTPRASRRAS